jgi:integrase
MSKMTDELTAWLLSYESGRAWYNKLLSDVTKRVYLQQFKRYCDAVKKSPDELVDLKIEGLKSINTSREFQAENLLETFLSTSRLTPNMKDSVKTAVLSFYAKNRRRLEPDTAENIQVPEPKKRCPSTQDLLELESAFTSLRDKALLWFVASAPFRLTSITRLKWRDLKPTNDKEIPYCMVIEGVRLKGSGIGKYKGVRQVGFLHHVASKKLEAYKMELVRKGYRITEDDPIFIPYRKEGKPTPFSPYSIEANFGEACLRAWHDLDKKRFSIHDLRSFVQTAMENAGVNSNMIAPILGHKPKGTDFHYSEHDIDDLKEKFRSALPYLLPQSMEALKAEAEKTNLLFREEIGTLENRTLELQTSLSELKEFISSNVQFGNYKEEEKEFLRSKYNLRKHSPEEIQRTLEFATWVKEISGKKGYMNEKDEMKLKRRMKAKLDREDGKLGREGGQ